MTLEILVLAWDRHKKVAGSMFLPPYPHLTLWMEKLQDNYFFKHGLRLNTNMSVRGKLDFSLLLDYRYKNVLLFFLVEI